MYEHWVGVGMMIRPVKFIKNENENKLADKVTDKDISGCGSDGTGWGASEDFLVPHGLLRKHGNDESEKYMQFGSFHDFYLLNPGYVGETAVAKGFLSAAKRFPMAAGNANFGYLAGGESPVTSVVDRIDYSNDTETTVTKGPLSVKRSQVGAAANGLYGYWSGGYNVITGCNIWLSLLYRMEFTSDTTTAVAKGPLSQTKGKGTNSSTGNKNYGWFGGAGWWPSSTRHSTIQRIQFSNDTATALLRGPFSAGR